MAMPDSVMLVDRYKALNVVADELYRQGFALPLAYKRRDPREPGREEKELLEDKMAAIMAAMFAAQKREIKGIIEQIFGGFAPPTNAEEFENILDELITQEVLMSEAHIRRTALALSTAAVNGVELFVDDMTLQTDFTSAEAEAAAWAAEHAGELIQGINQTTRDAIAKAVTKFIEVPGTTLNDVINAIPFSENRSQMIAITEITGAYGQGGQIAGEKLQVAFPDVQVIKTWWTNNDALVCPLCGQFQPSTNAKIDEEFVGNAGFTAFTPTAHVRCRCWMTYSTVLTAEDVQ